MMGGSKLRATIGQHLVGGRLATGVNAKYCIHMLQKRSETPCSAGRLTFRHGGSACGTSKVSAPSATNHRLRGGACREATVGRALQGNKLVVRKVKVRMRELPPDVEYQLDDTVEQMNWGQRAAWDDDGETTPRQNATVEALALLGCQEKGPERNSVRTTELNARGGQGRRTIRLGCRAGRVASSCVPRGRTTWCAMQKPHEFIRFMTITMQKPYEFIRFMTITMQKPYEFMRFMTVTAQKPHEFLRFTEVVDLRTDAGLSMPGRLLPPMNKHGIIMGITMGIMGIIIGIIGII